MVEELWLICEPAPPSLLLLIGTEFSKTKAIRPDISFTGEASIATEFGWVVGVMQFGI